jgi:hypothetical protein
LHVRAQRKPYWVPPARAINPKEETVAARINAGDVGRGDVFFIAPQEIIVDEQLNGRWTPHDAEAV